MVSARYFQTGERAPKVKLLPTKRIVSARAGAGDAMRSHAAATASNKPAPLMSIPVQSNRTPADFDPCGLKAAWRWIVNHGALTKHAARASVLSLRAKGGCDERRW